MKRWEPIAYPGPDNGFGAATHRNFNQSTGERGSWLDADGYQQMIDELSRLVELAGLILDGNDAGQVAKAIQSGKLSWATSVGGTANAITATLAPAVTALAAGMVVNLQIQNTNTGPTTIAFNGTPAKNVVTDPNLALAGGELLAGASHSFLFDGTNLQLLTQGRRGRLINVRTFTTSQTYTPTPGTNSVVVMVVGGGGAGGGAPATAAAQQAAGSGGGAGGWTRKRLTTGFSGTSMVIGAAGAGVAGANGGAGGNTSFGSVVGNGGAGGSAGTVQANTVNFPLGGAGGGQATGGDFNGLGGAGQFALYTTGGPLAGAGGASVMGAGGVQATGFTSGNPGVAPGSGGGGAVNGPSSAAVVAGGAGVAGLIIVEEYS